MPVIKIITEEVDYEYAWLVSVIFTMAFIVGAALSLSLLKKGKPDYVKKIDFTNFGRLIIIIWSLAVIYISFQYGLYNRRIGTEAAGELFSSIPVYALIAFRSFEIVLPFIMSVIIINCVEKTKISLKDSVLTSILVVTFYLLGAGSSRAATLILIITLLVLIQNRIPKEAIVRLGTILITISILALSIIQLNRLDSDERTISEYAASEVINRLDGIELLSKLTEIHELKLTGINIKSAYNALISLMPLSERSIELKAEGLTTIKSVALDEEFGSKERDHNSFIIFDIYYLFGLMGILGFGLLLGLACCFVDKKIFLNQGAVGLIATVTIGTNLIILEREFFGLIISAFRDFVIICCFSLIALEIKKGS